LVAVVASGSVGAQACNRTKVKIAMKTLDDFMTHSPFTSKPGKNYTLG